MAQHIDFSEFIRYRGTWYGVTITGWKHAGAAYTVAIRVGNSKTGSVTEERLEDVSRDTILERLAPLPVSFDI